MIAFIFDCVRKAIWGITVVPLALLLIPLFFLCSFPLKWPQKVLGFWIEFLGWLTIIICGPLK